MYNERERSLHAMLISGDRVEICISQDDRHKGDHVFMTDEQNVIDSFLSCDWKSACKFIN